MGRGQGHVTLLHIHYVTRVDVHQFRGSYITGSAAVKNHFLCTCIGYTHKRVVRPKCRRPGRAIPVFLLPLLTHVE